MSWEMLGSGTLAALPEDTSSVPNTHVWYLILYLTPASRESNNLFWHPGALHTCHTEMERPINKNKPRTIQERYISHGFS